MCWEEYAAVLKPFARLKSLDMSGNPLVGTDMAFSCKYGDEGAVLIIQRGGHSNCFMGNPSLLPILSQLTALRALNMECNDKLPSSWFLWQLTACGACTERFHIGMRGDITSANYATWMCVDGLPGVRELSISWKSHRTFKAVE